MHCALCTAHAKAVKMEVMEFYDVLLFIIFNLEFRVDLGGRGRRK